MHKLLELAERCEQATGPDSDLDNDIHEAVFRGPVLSEDEMEAALARGECVFSGCMVWRGALTASIDAAMTLVPEGALWQLTNDPKPRAYLEPCGGAPYAATPVLALCAAALRARAAGRRHRPYSSVGQG